MQTVQTIMIKDGNPFFAGTVLTDTQLTNKQKLAMNWLGLDSH